jgi:tetratricopeptide (TPR) repeat protein
MRGKGPPGRKKALRPDAVAKVKEPAILTQHQPVSVVADSSNKIALLIMGLICFALLAVYAPTFSHGYVYYDDDRYVYDNPVIRGGLTGANIAWAFTTFSNANWHPLTWISYFIDYDLFGLNPGAQHVENFLFHLGSTILLFLALARMTGRRISSAVVAGIFALHPLHVESVAWVSERKDVLNTFFEMLTLWLYAGYAKHPRLRTYLMVTASYALSLLSKPMAVTLPFVLLLLDFWPLKRLEPNNWKSERTRHVLSEKIPLLGMAILASVLTAIAQQRGVAVQTLMHLPVGDRVANALIGYCRYIGMAILPVNLAVLYPFREGPVAGKAILSALLLFALTAGAWFLRARPYILIGWLWFLGTLVPVIGIIQVGVQTIADRYTYFPMVGLSIAAVWAIGDYVRTRPGAGRTAIVVAFSGLLVLAAIAHQQAGYWADSETLFRHALAATGNNPVIANNLGVVLQRQGRVDEAADLYRQAIASTPDYASAQTNLGVILAGQGKHEEAIALYRRALSEDPQYAIAHTNLGDELLVAGRYSEAHEQLAEAISENPQLKEAQAEMGMLLAAQGKFSEAKPFLKQADNLDPTQPDTKTNLCFVLVRLNELDDAIAVCRDAVNLSPNGPAAHYSLGTALAAKGRSQEAAAEFSRVLALNPALTQARAALEAVTSKK